MPYSWIFPLELSIFYDYDLNAWNSLDYKHTSKTNFQNNLLYINSDTYHYTDDTSRVLTLESKPFSLFRFTLFPMMWTVKNDFDEDPFYQDRKAVRCVVSIRV